MEVFFSKKKWGKGDCNYSLYQIMPIVFDFGECVSKITNQIIIPKRISHEIKIHFINV